MPVYLCVSLYHISISLCVSMNTLIYINAYMYVSNA